MNPDAAPGTGRLGTGKTVNTTCGGARFSNLQHEGVSSVIRGSEFSNFRTGNRGSRSNRRDTRIPLGEGVLNLF